MKTTINGVEIETLKLPMLLFSEIVSSFDDILQVQQKISLLTSKFEVMKANKSMYTDDQILEVTTELNELTYELNALIRKHQWKILVEVFKMVMIRPEIKGEKDVLLLAQKLDVESLFNKILEDSGIKNDESIEDKFRGENSSVDSGTGNSTESVPNTS